MFELQQKTTTVRGQTVTIREITQKERGILSDAVADDRRRADAVLISLGSVEPKFTEEQAAALPAKVAEKLAREIMNLAGVDTEDDDEKKD